MTDEVVRLIADYDVNLAEHEIEVVIDTLIVRAEKSDNLESELDEARAEVERRRWWAATWKEKASGYRECYNNYRSLAKNRETALQQAQAEVERLRAERDQARAEVRRLRFLIERAVTETEDLATRKLLLTAF